MRDPMKGYVMALVLELPVAPGETPEEVWERQRLALFFAGLLTAEPLFVTGPLECEADDIEHPAFDVKVYGGFGTQLFPADDGQSD